MPQRPVGGFAEIARDGPEELHDSAGKTVGVTSLISALSDPLVSALSYRKPNVRLKISGAAQACRNLSKNSCVSGYVLGASGAAHMLPSPAAEALGVEVLKAPALAV